MLIRAVCGAIAGAALIAATSAVGADPWPTRTVKVISPFTAGNASDTVARIVLDQVSQQVGQAFIIESRPGAGGTAATEFVAKADRDGYTFLLSSASLGSQIVFHKTLAYDAIRDFSEVSLIGIQPNVLVASLSSGIRTVNDLVVAAKARPGVLTFASAGLGSASHMAGERFRVATRIDVRHIPFRGAEGLAEVIAGRIDFYIVPVAAAAPLIAGNKIAVLAVTTPKRAASLQNVPTMAEAGYPDAGYVFWSGLAAPSKTPRTIVDALHDEVQKALEAPGTRDNLAKLGVEPQPMSVGQFEQFVKDDIAATLRLAKDAHIEAAD